MSVANTDTKDLFKFILRLSDNALILGHRLSEWCGHGPVLEQDIALTNIALDFIGQARNLYQLAAKIEDADRSEDDLAFLREEREYYNCLLVEQPNGHFGTTIARQFLYDAYNYFYYEMLKSSSHKQLSNIAKKSHKEIAYHLKYSSEWVKRLGDGTEESHHKIQEAFDGLWMYTGELITADELDAAMLSKAVAPDLLKVRSLWEEQVQEIMHEATLVIPQSDWMQSGGKKGVHTEHLGYLLAEMQYMQRTYPNSKW